MCVLAVVTTIAFWTQGDSSIDPLVMHPAAFHGEPWRLLTSALPHAGMLHLVFNLYWTWIFGTLIEERLGSGLTVGLAVFIAAGSSAAEYAVMWGGIGLSGVVYGLFGFLWILQRRDPRFLGTLPHSIVQLMVAWFFICIFLTWSGMMPIANVAHGAGAAIGVALGLALAAKSPVEKAQMAALNVAAVLALVAAATVALPTVNVAGAGNRDLAWRGVMALEEGRVSEGMALIGRAAAVGAFDPDVADRFEELRQDLNERARSPNPGGAAPGSPPPDSGTLPEERAGGGEDP